MTTTTCQNIVSAGYKIGEPRRTPGPGDRGGSRADEPEAERRRRPARPDDRRTERERGCTDDQRGLGEQGLLQGPRRRQGRVARPTSRRPTASSPATTTPTPTRATRPPRSASRRSPRPTTSSATPRSASSTTSCARCSRAASARSRPAGRAARQPFDFNDLFGGGTGRGGAAAGSATSSVACSAAARPHPGAAQPRRGADIETDATIGFADSIEGVTVSLRLSSDAPCPDCSGTGAKAGTMPRVCPDCEGVGMRAASVGGAFTMNETCPTCRGRGLVVDDPCPTCHGSGRGMSDRTIQARIPAGVKDGQRIRLRGKGAQRRARRPARRPLRRRQGRRRTRCSVARATTSRSRCRSASTRPPSAPTSRCRPSAGARSRSRSRRARPTAAPSASAAAARRARTAHGRPARHRRGRRCPRTLDDEARAAVEAYRDATGGADLRAGLFEARAPGSG